MFKNNNKLKILFISHSASRTGATVALLTFLRWIKKNTKIYFEIIIKKKAGGALLPEFRALAPVLVFSDTAAGRLDYLQIFFDRFGFSMPGIWHLKNLFGVGTNLRGFDLVYSNTVTNGEILSLFPSYAPPVICHVHELEWAIQHYGISKFNVTKNCLKPFHCRLSCCQGKSDPKPRCAFRSDRPQL